MPNSLNQYHGEIQSFCNQLTSQITELTISLLNVLVNLRENVSIYIILTASIKFLRFWINFHL